MDLRCAGVPPINYSSISFLNFSDNLLHNTYTILQISIDNYLYFLTDSENIHPLGNWTRDFWITNPVVKALPAFTADSVVIYNVILAYWFIWKPGHLIPVLRSPGIFCVKTNFYVPYIMVLEQVTTSMHQKSHTCALAHNLPWRLR